ncbi:uncharacterized protein C9orf57 homolog [Tenrec ecaudatus]|uniref:uncharacterized protein C9orf57 homolog n=1 Tax=Tenrec ecaudatus TaxID=94439 RepID=UPI003F595AE6
MNRHYTPTFNAPISITAKRWKQPKTLDYRVSSHLLDDADADINYVSVICRVCNLSLPFHGCLLDFGTCRTMPGQFCIKEIHTKLGIQWYSVKGCTANQNECFRRIVSTYAVLSTHCCHKPFCNF